MFTLNVISTSSFINELSVPKNIKSIEIETPKSTNYYKNFLELFNLKQII